MKKNISKWVCAGIFLFTVSIAGTAIGAEPQGPMSSKAFIQAQKADMKAEKAGEIFTMHGKIKDIDLQQRTVVIDCPEASRIFTVGGPLVSNVNLKIKGKIAQLSDFKVRNEVSVKWKSTMKGHVILALKMQ